MRSRVRSLLLLPVLVLLGAAWGCVASHAVDDDGLGNGGAVGTIAAELTWEGREFSTVSYWLRTLDGTVQYDGELDITVGPRVIAFIDGIAPDDYVLELEAVSDDGMQICRGDTPVTVRVGATWNTWIGLLCIVPLHDTGSINVDAYFDYCIGTIQGATVSPRVARVGESMTILLEVWPGWERIDWVPSSGTIRLLDGIPYQVEYTCEAPGEHTIAVTAISILEECLPDTREFTVECY